MINVTPAAHRRLAPLDSVIARMIEIPKPSDDYHFQETFAGVRTRVHERKARAMYEITGFVLVERCRERLSVMSRRVSMITSDRGFLTSASECSGCRTRFRGPKNNKYVFFYFSPYAFFRRWNHPSKFIRRRTKVPIVSLKNIITVCWIKLDFNLICQSPFLCKKFIKFLRNLKDKLFYDNWLVANPTLNECKENSVR